MDSLQRQIDLITPRIETLEAKEALSEDDRNHLTAWRAKETALIAQQTILVELLLEEAKRATSEAKTREIEVEIKLIQAKSN